ncbi:conserved hypothetical protein [Histoplasma capsulatum G186AR]|uniref:Uncharacterized protein n=2 Tax=Ajellomyces capsulatus TaxID=5037 RepID=C0NDJ7_AJECG|nr:uncharacterized protein HCBG_01940 [Histoplasma capsulatum G186AR]EEH10295.1 conserved hypothetical protein [Histoplasma capsulatum G186AR]KAG5290746.1 hypothetical protein I7I52_07864 [Histoplasma capsulatum]QSS72674.1 hypothetical protein I7I50_00596 [Histoplasma capsulatum G186AR]
MPDSLAAFRGTTRQELVYLGREHLKHNLQQSDRDTLNSAASKLATHTAVGSVVGIGLGIWLGLRVRRMRMNIFNTFKVMERPTHVQFVSGRLEPVPDLSPLLRPTILSDMAMFTLFAAGGLFMGGETGLVTGVYSARRTIGKDPESKERIQRAFEKLRAEMLRRQADALDGGQSVSEKVTEIF